MRAGREQPHPIIEQKVGPLTGSIRYAQDMGISAAQTPGKGGEEKQF